jgi:hypothetical protein
MVIPDLGKLVEVNIREAWHHEAHSFTPWLAQHLDILAQEIGIPLELEGREVAVETFAADILARNPLNDSLVLIENQLESTDHSHLGQIMTYLAGLEAHTVIWVAAAFREAHLSAIRWLNDHTVAPFAFFAVKVKVVRIADSPLAPVFEVLVRPNQWERQLQAVAQETRSASDLMQFRKAFWEYYSRKYPKIAQDVVSGASSNRWRAIKNLGLVISSYVAKRSVGIFIRSGTNSSSEEAYQILLPFAEELSLKTGATIGEAGGTYFFGSVYPADTSDRSRWDELVDWLYEKTELYELTLKTLGGIDGP